MAYFWHKCGQRTRGRVYRLASTNVRYEFEKVLHCKRCGRCREEVYMHAGVFADGKQTDFFAIPKAEHAQWAKRIAQGEAFPKLRCTSEYTLRVRRGAEQAGYYLRRSESHVKKRHRAKHDHYRPL